MYLIFHINKIYKHEKNEQAQLLEVCGLCLLPF